MFFLRQQKNHLGIAFDVGTASVSAVLFEFNEKPKVLKVFRRFHKASLQKDSLHFNRSTVAQFSGVLKDATDFLKGVTPHMYVIGLSSVFYLGKTEHFYTHTQKPAQFKEADFHELIESGKKRLLDELKRDDVVIFEAVFLKALLNGYPVEEPLGRSAQEVEMWVRFSATSQNLYAKFQEIISAANKKAEIHLVTFPVSAWFLARSMLPPEHSAILVDIGSESTEVTFIVNGIITDILSLPIGVLNILLRLAEVEHSDIENAFSLLVSYTSGALSEEAEVRVQETIKKEIKSWEESFERIWQHASRDMMVNIRMFFLGGGGLIDEVKNMLTPPLLHPDIAKELHVSVLTPEAYRERFREFCCLEGPGDFGLLSLILYTMLLVKKPA